MYEQSNYRDITILKSKRSMAIYIVVVVVVVSNRDGFFMP